MVDSGKRAGRDGNARQAQTALQSARAGSCRFPLWRGPLAGLAAHRVSPPAKQLPAIYRADAFETREAFAALNKLASSHAVVAFRPIDAPLDRHGEVITAGEFDQRILVMDTGRQMLNAERECATQFGGDPSQCPEIQQSTPATLCVSGSERGVGTRVLHPLRRSVPGHQPPRSELGAVPQAGPRHSPWSRSSPTSKSCNARTTAVDSSQPELSRAIC